MSAIEQAEHSLRLARVSEATTQQHRRNAWLALETALKTAATPADKDEYYGRFVREFEFSTEVTTP